jgi:hypothetical protein
MTKLKNSQIIVCMILMSVSFAFIVWVTFSTFCVVFSKFNVPKFENKKVPSRGRFEDWVSANRETTLHQQSLYFVDFCIPFPF